MESAQYITEAFRGGKTTPLEVMASTLLRIEERNPAVNAFRVVDSDAAMSAAAASTARWRRDAPCGPFDGVPISVKDTLMVEGFAFRQGSLATEEVPAKESAPVVRTMREAGAIVVGITTCSEFGSSALTVSPLTGVTRNPHDPSRHSGGSSGGAAAGVTAGMLSLALGSDAAGSVRIPASFCGAIGFKPSGGVIPAFPRNVAGPLSSPGFLATTVSDAARALRISVAPDPRDAEAAPYLDAEVDLQETGLRGIRVAYSKTLGYVDILEGEIETLVSASVKALEAQGATVDEVDPGFSDPEELISFMLTMGYAHMLRNLTEAQFGRLTPAVQQRIEAGRELSAMDFMAIQERRIELARHMASFHERYDVLVTPTLPITAFAAESTVPPGLAEGTPALAWMRYVYPFNLTQQPAISLPCGTTSAGLPAGMQIVGPKRRDAKVLRCARAYELAAGPLVAEIASGSAGSRNR
jgi:aspartyl-tRNA(Asn)/glutamyl-tRNA(Gln) amidotransferase subunit A